MQRLALLGIINAVLALASIPSAMAQTPTGAALFEERCAVCHGAHGDGGQGPALQGLVGRQAGTTRFGYSQALRAAGFAWTPERLDQYLADPIAAVPGTRGP